MAERAGRLLALTLMGATFLLSACQVGQPVPATPPNHIESSSDPPAGETDASDHTGWPFWPARLRVYPLTRIAKDSATGHQMIETRIEFIDDYGDTTKCSGQIRIDLFDAGAGATTPITQWNIDLRDPAINDSHFDDITRTYLFKLEIQPDQLPNRSELRVYFLSSDGRTLRDSHTLK